MPICRNGPRISANSNAGHRVRTLGSHTMQHLTLWHYRRALRAPLPLHTRQQSLVLPVRDGLLLEWRDGARHHWTEIAPLPLFSRESLANAQAVVLGLARSTPINDYNQLAEQLRDPARDLPVSVQYGIEAGLAWLVQANEPPGSESFSPSLCGLALAGSTKTSPYRVVKQKIDGVDFNRDCRGLIAAVAQLAPGQRLRIDCNGSWSLAQAIAALSPLASARIDYVEEPLRTMDLDQCQALHRATGLSLALDESLRAAHGDFVGTGLAQLTTGRLRACGISALVIKPMLTGFIATEALIQFCARCNVQAVLSSAFESSVALNHYWQLAQQHQLSAAQGLDTAHFFADSQTASLGTPNVPAGLTHVADLF